MKLECLSRPPCRPPSPAEIKRPLALPGKVSSLSLKTPEGTRANDDVLRGEARDVPVTGSAERRQQERSCHLFRHAMATLMLENGADLRYIQQMLGHARLNTTEIYTHVNIRKLIEVHQLTHPAKLPQAGKAEPSPNGADAPSSL